ncbi:MAG: aminotransferase class V-fold PLP-dependent enzyme [Chloroflexota bacterium]
MIYLDNAATSFPKPDAVIRAMSNFLERAGGNPGRSGHRLSIEAGRIVYDAREAIAELFHARDPLRVIFTLNATHALNLALRGILRPGDRVVTTGIEHNAVMRPLRALERADVRVIVVPCARDGSLDLDAMYRAVEPGTRLVVVNHASNVVGTILPIAEIARIAHAAGALILVDAAQTAGVLPIDIAAMKIDLLAFTGHKGLYGPPGTGGLVLGENVDAATLEPLWRGGTGSRSEFEEQPDDLPDKFESGTPNGVGIAGLGAGVRFVLERDVDAIRAHEVALTQMLVEGLRAISGVVVHGTGDAELQTATVSFTVAHRRVSEIGLRLDEEFGVLCRVGLHCAPAAHRTIDTFPQGTVRLASSVFTTEEDIRVALDAVRRIVQG